MVKYNFLGAGLAAAVLFMPALGAPGQLGQISASFASVVVPLAKRGSLIEVQGGYFQRYPNEGTQGWTPTEGHRHTIVNKAGATVWVWIEITVWGEPTVKVNEPSAPWAEKIRLGPGESVQIGEHSYTLRHRSSLCSVHRER